MVTHDTGSGEPNGLSLPALILVHLYVHHLASSGKTSLFQRRLHEHPILELLRGPFAGYEVI